MATMPDFILSAPVTEVTTLDNGSKVASEVRFSHNLNLLEIVLQGDHGLTLEIIMRRKRTMALHVSWSV